MISGKLVLGLITARGGSKSVPKKNIIPISGKPLLNWTIEAAKSSSYLDKIVLSTDDPEIMEVGRMGGCEVPFQRSSELASDTASSVDVVIDALERVPGFDIVVLLQPTSPMRLAKDIDGALERLINANAPACVSVRSALDHPYLIFGNTTDGRIYSYTTPHPNDSMRRQDLPTAWCLNGAVFVARVDWFMRERTFISQQTVIYQMPIDRSLDIDTPEDVKYFMSII